jgi:hypothetical protein
MQRDQFDHMPAQDSQVFVGQWHLRTSSYFRGHPTIFPTSALT